MISINWYLDTRRVKETGSYPLKIRLTHERKQFYVPVMDMDKQAWEKIQSGKYLGKYTDIKQNLDSLIGRARKICERTKPFDFKRFKKEWDKKDVDRSDLLSLLDARKDQLIKSNRFGTAATFRNTSSSISKFIKSNSSRDKSLPLSAVDPEWLEQYENWMLENGKSSTTIGIYLRNVRAIFNQEIDYGALSLDLYPFGKNKYVIPKPRNIKKALDDSDLKKLFEHKSSIRAEQKALDFWKLLFLLNGINTKDLCLLHYHSIEDKTIYLSRYKTERTTKSDPEVITIPLLPEAEKLISLYAVGKTKNQGLVFDLVDANSPKEKQHLQILQASKTINKYMGRVAQELRINQKVTTYTARHTYATKLKRSGASYEMIKENLGHKSLNTTEKYLASFDLKEKRAMQENLLRF